MKNIIGSCLLAAALAGSARADSTSCWIWVQGDCHGWVAANQWLPDNYNGSSTNNGACLHRAREFVQWCGLRNPGDQVYAAFNIGSVTSSAQVFRPRDASGAAEPVAVNFGLNWVPIVASANEDVEVHASLAPGAIAAKLPNLTSLRTSIDPRKIPLRTALYSSSYQGKGIVYACDPKMFSMSTIIGNQVGGPWIGTSTYDSTAKPVQQGANFLNGRFSITESGSRRVFLGNGFPVGGLPVGNYPVRSGDPAYQYDPNPNPLVEQTVSFSVPLNPVVAAQPSCVYKEVGITIDGVALHTAVDSSGRDENAYQLADACGGRSQPGGLYHRSAMSTCIRQMHEVNALVGYALDGFGIYSPIQPDGHELTSADLDQCHGTTSPVVFNGRLVTMYHYVLTRDFPYSINCFRGTPTRNAFPPLPGAPPQQ